MAKDHTYEKWQELGYQVKRNEKPEYKMYGKKIYTRDQVFKKNKENKTKSYNRSEQMAYENGFRAVEDDDAYNGRYFIRDGEKWIHCVEALMQELGVDDEDELEAMGYDISIYYAYTCG